MVSPDLPRSGTWLGWARWGLPESRIPRMAQSSVGCCIPGVAIRSLCSTLAPAMRLSANSPRILRPMLLAIFSLAVLARGLAAWSLRERWSEDRDLYLTIARELVAGRGYSRPLTWQVSPTDASDNGGETSTSAPSQAWLLTPGPGAIPVCRLVIDEAASGGAGRAELAATSLPTAYRPPLYPVLIAAVLWLGGGVGGVIAGQVLLGGVTAVLAMLAARRLGCPGHGVVAGLAVAVDPLLVGYSPQLMTETLAAFLVALVSLLAVGRGGRAQGVFLGGLLGLCALCRPTFLATGLLWGLALVWHPPEGPSRRRLLIVMLWGMTALVVAPWGVRNRAVLGDWIVSTTHGGYTLRLAHNPAYDEWLAGDHAAPFSGDAFARSAVPQIATVTDGRFEVAVDQAHARAAWGHMARNPRQAFVAGASLWSRLWGPVPESLRSAPWWIRWGIGLFQAGVLLAAALGIWQLGKLRNCPLLVGWMGALLVSFTLVHFLYWADSRMRAPMLPGLAVLAAYGVHWLTIPIARKTLPQ